MHDIRGSEGYKELIKDYVQMVIDSGDDIDDCMSEIKDAYVKKVKSPPWERGDDLYIHLVCKADCIESIEGLEPMMDEIYDIVRGYGFKTGIFANKHTAMKVLSGNR